MTAALFNQDQGLFAARTVNLADMRAFVLAAARRQWATGPDLDDIELAVDEALANVIEHGYRGHAEEGLIRLEVSGDAASITITIVDQAGKFDPRSVPTPDLDQVRRDFQVGGLGLFLVRTLMNDMAYETKPDGNYLRLTKRMADPARLLLTLF